MQQFIHDTMEQQIKDLQSLVRIPSVSRGEPAEPGKPFGKTVFAALECALDIARRLGFEKVWCGYYDGNEKSKRVQEKLGFVHQWTSDDVPVPQLGEVRRGHVNLLTKNDWKARRSIQ